MHRLRDVEVDLSRTGTGNGAETTAVARRSALDRVRIDPQKGSVETKRGSAGRTPAVLRDILGLR